MLIISDEEKSGINGFYSVFFGGNKYIYGLNWDKYKKFVNAFVAVNIAFCFYFIWLLKIDIEDTQKLFKVSFPLFFGYIFLKLKVCQPRVKILATEKVKRKVAPVSVWLDYFFLGVAGVILQRVIMKTTSDVLFHYWAIFLQVNFAMYALMPFITYMDFKSNKNKKIK